MSTLLVTITRYKEEGDDECHDWNLRGAPFILLVDNGLARRRRDRRKRSS